MSTYRNLQFYGIAYGDTPVTLDVKINGQQVFLNTVSTTPGAMPVDITQTPCDQILFEIDNTDLFPTTFEGYYSHSIAVSGGNGILVGPVLSNYMLNKVGNTSVAGNVTAFGPVYFGSPVNSENTPDVRSSVTIDGGVQVPPNDVSQGIWAWVIPSGSNLACNLNISAGNVATA